VTAAAPVAFPLLAAPPPRSGLRPVPYDPVVDDGRDQPNPVAGRDPAERPPPLPAGAIAPAVIVYCVLIPVVEVTRSLAFTPYSAQFLPTAVAAALMTPLTIHIVRNGLSGTPAPYGRSVLAVLSAVAIGAAAVIGDGWSLMLVFPALAAFLTLPWPWASAVLVMEVTVLLIGTGVAGWPFTPVYYAFAVAFRVAALVALVATVAAHHQLLAARAQLRDAAVMRERLRIDDDVHRVVAPLLGRVSVAAPSTERELADLVEQARTTLAATRRIIVGNQRRSMARELDTAVALLGAAGIPTRVVAPSVDLDRLASVAFSCALRGAVTAMLATEPDHPIDLVVTPDDDVEVHPRGTRPTVDERSG
jgi:hypothetical protein